MAVPRLVQSLVAFRVEANARYPDRDKSSDGWIGDTAHSSRVSDHNPDSRGLVHAYDLDEDVDGNPTDSGAELAFLAEHIRGRRDPRVKYVIYEDQIFAGRGGPKPWQWRPYDGVNEHRHHMHLSVLSDDIGENDTSPWFPPAPPTPDHPEDDMQDYIMFIPPNGPAYLNNGVDVLGPLDAATLAGYRVASIKEIAMSEGSFQAIQASVELASQQRAEMVRLLGEVNDRLAGLDPGTGGGSFPDELQGTFTGAVTLNPAANT